MSDLAEIRRFWPWVRANDQTRGRGFYPRNRRGIYLGLGYSEAIFQFPAGWWIWVQDDRDWRERHRNPWSGTNIDTPAGVRYPSIAAAMAAAGFGRRLPGIRAIWRRGDAPAIKLQSSQRPRKGVRLGKRGRRLALAASMGEALDATKHWRAK